MQGGVKNTVTAACDPVTSRAKARSNANLKVQGDRRYRPATLSENLKEFAASAAPCDISPDSGLEEVWHAVQVRSVLHIQLLGGAT